MAIQAVMMNDTVVGRRKREPSHAQGNSNVQIVVEVSFSFKSVCHLDTKTFKNNP